MMYMEKRDWISLVYFVLIVVFLASAFTVLERIRNEDIYWQTLVIIIGLMLAFFTALLTSIIITKNDNT